MTDYIPRLREELVAAATRERAGLRHRPRLRAAASRPGAGHCGGRGGRDRGRPRRRAPA